MNLFEKNVFESFKKGDEKAFEYIFKTYFGYLLNYSRQILKDSYAAEEIVETTFLNLWENRNAIHLETSLKSYLFKSVYNTCLNHIKHQHVKERYVLYFKHHIATDDSGEIISAEYPVSQLIEKELNEILEQSVQSLPAQCREIFIMSRYQNMKNEEIAQKLNISVNTVRTQISRALAKLRENLKDFLPFIIWLMVS
jgi:RNA polymerase sigma-70 factor, ECF subfamily